VLRDMPRSWKGWGRADSNVVCAVHRTFKCLRNVAQSQA